VTPPPEDLPPLLGSWRNLYALVLGNLAFMVLVFAWLTWRYS
jgi:hypothetical protein